VSRPPPILDYRSPEESRDTSIPVAVRALLGLFAALSTLFAGMALAGGVDDGRWDHILLGCLFAVISYFLWRPVGLRLLPRWVHRRR
jgi:hypothetical protein